MRGFMGKPNGKKPTKSTGKKILYIGLAIGLLFFIFSSYIAYRYIGETKKQRLAYLKQTVQIARNSIEPVISEYRSQTLTRETAINNVRNIIRRMVYEDSSGHNYIFMSNYDGTMLVHPFDPQKEMSSAQQNNEYDIYRLLSQAAQSEAGEGYVSYNYKKPGGEALEKKVSFVMGIPELDCYIGTGKYMSDLYKSQYIYITAITVLTLVLLTLLFLLVRSSTKEIRSQNMLLKKAEQELSEILNNTFQFIGTLTPEGILTRANRTALDFIGQDAQSVIGLPFWETPWWKDDEMKERLKKAVHECTQGKFCRFEVTHTNEMDEKYSADFSLSPICDENGKVLFLLAEGRDITDLLMTKQELIDAKELSDNLISSLPGIFFLYKWENGRFFLKQWNEEYHEKMLGYSKEELLNVPIDFFINDEDLSTLNTAISKALTEKKSIVSEMEIASKDGRSVPFWMMARSFKQGNNQYLVGTGIDLTEQREAEQEKDLMEKMLHQTQKLEALGTLAGGIAHDFNNILTAILGYAELVLMDMPPESPSYDMQEQIVHGAMRARDLIKQILLFSRQSEQEMKPVRPELIIRDALKLLRPSIPATIEIRQNIAENQGTILADGTQLHQIIMNLCTNSYHAMRESGGLIEVSLSVKDIPAEKMQQTEISLAPGTYFFLEVKDTGQGMTEETLEKVFNPYFTTKEKGKGTGLGLSVVHGIVKNIGGEIQIESTLGEGTQIHIYFPKLETPGPMAGALQKGALKQGDERILLVDDESAVLNATRLSLENLGYQVTALSDSRAALETFRTSHKDFDMVITDMTMPGMTGFELAGEIQDIVPDLPVVLCTGYSELLTKEKALENGIRKVLMKPVLREILATTIREIFDSQQQ